MTIKTGFRRIGLFDSGVGGLSVLRQLVMTMPETDFVYLGDTARVPYGDRSRSEVAMFVEEIIDFLSDFKLDAVVMATVATTKSHAFARALAALNFDDTIFEIGCPQLIPLIESGCLGEPSVEAALNQALCQYLLEMAGVEAIVLGCTHFPFLQSRIKALLTGPLKAYFPGTVAILVPEVVLSKTMQPAMPVEAIPDMVAKLESKEADLNSDKIEIFTTGTAQSFGHTAGYCLGQELVRVRQIKIKQRSEAGKNWQGQQALCLSPAFEPSVSFA